MSNLLRIDSQNVLDYTETAIQNVLDSWPPTKDIAFRQLRTLEEASNGRYVERYRK